MNDSLYIIIAIFSVTFLVSELFMLYMIVKLDDIVGNIEDRFTYFNEELVILADVLKEYRSYIDDIDVPIIPIPTGKDVSNW